MRPWLSAVTHHCLLFKVFPRRDDLVRRGSRPSKGRREWHRRKPPQVIGRQALVGCRPLRCTPAELFVPPMHVSFCGIIRFRLPVKRAFLATPDIGSFPLDGEASVSQLCRLKDTQDRPLPPTAGCLRTWLHESLRNGHFYEPLDIALGL
jgi:hypothetical protein